MRSIITALWMGGRSLGNIIFHPLFWLVIFIVSRQYKKHIKMERQMLGMEREGILGKTINSAVYGLVGGVIGSIIIIVLGVSLRQEDIIYIWPIAILLFMINTRYLCFSYAGGLLSLFSLIFGFPKVDVAGLMALVAVLHLVESFLIYVNGHKDSLPIIIDKGNGQHIGGYSLQRFWPIPILIMTLALNSEIIPTSQVEMPNWWPIIKPFGFENIDNLTMFMISIVAALGYGDISLTQLPRMKVRRSALHLGIYSIVLLILAVVSSRIGIVQWIAALFAPVFHEFIILQGRKQERQGKPLFTPPDKGIRVLEVLEGSASDKMNIQRGDILYSINNIAVNHQKDIIEILKECPTFVWIKGENYRGEQYTKELKVFPYGLRTLGILPLPPYSELSYVVKEKESVFKRFLNRKKAESR